MTGVGICKQATGRKLEETEHCSDFLLYRHPPGISQSSLPVALLSSLPSPVRQKTGRNTTGIEGDDLL